MSERPWDDVPCGLVIVDADGVIVESNATLRTWTGFTPDALAGRRFGSLLDPGSRLLYETRVAPILQLKGSVDATALTIVGSDGAPLAALVTAMVADDGRMSIAIMDARERVDYERELLAARRAAEASELRVRVLQSAAGAFSSSLTEGELAAALARSVREAFGATSAAVFLVEPDGSLSLAGGADPFAAAASEYRPQSLALSSGEIVTVSTIADAAAFSPHLAGAMDAARISSTSATPITTPDGIVGVLVTHFARERAIDAVYVEVQSALALQAAEVLVRLRLQRELEHIALHDGLTGLANRKLLGFYLDHAVRGPDGFSLLFIDLDGFKSVNDAYGHATGDAVLRLAATRIVESVRGTDVVGRFGGDEFVILCAGVGGDAVEQLAERVRAAVLEGYPSAPAARVSASIGIAVVGETRIGGVTVAEVLNIADNAMYDAKALGKNRVVVRVA